MTAKSCFGSVLGYLHLLPYSAWQESGGRHLRHESPKTVGTCLRCMVERQTPEASTFRTVAKRCTSGSVMILRFTWYMSSDPGCNVWAVTVIFHDVCEGKEGGEGTEKGCNGVIFVDPSSLVGGLRLIR